MATPNAILDYAQSIQRDYPKVRVGHKLSWTERNALELLAQEYCGMVASTTVKASDADLISVYSVALKDPAGSRRTAEKIHKRLDDTFFPAPEPAPRAPSEPAEVDLDAVRDLIKQEVREGALEPLQSALEALAEEHTRELVRVGPNALALMNEALTQAAHLAAAEALKSLTPTRLEVSVSAGDVKSLGLVHRETAKIIRYLAAKRNVYLHGPAGSGKTTVARKAAEAFGLQFYFAAKVESEYMLLGFKDAKGETVRTQFRDAYEHGGVFLFDELDASAASAVVALNAALANGICPFPDGTIARHPDFHCIGAGNTKLTGATRAYAGRNQMDAASIDRFTFVEFAYDDELEKALATDPKWCSYVQRARAVVAERGLNHLITPRATYDGCALLAAGEPWEEVADAVIWKGLDRDTVRQIQDAL